MFNANLRGNASQHQTEHPSMDPQKNMPFKHQLPNFQGFADHPTVFSRFIPTATAAWTPTLNGQYYQVHAPVFNQPHIQRQAQHDRPARLPICEPARRSDTPLQRTPNQNVIHQNGDWETRIVRRTVSQYGHNAQPDHCLTIDVQGNSNDSLENPACHFNDSSAYAKRDSQRHRQERRQNQRSCGNEMRTDTSTHLSAAAAEFPRLCRLFYGDNAHSQFSRRQECDQRNLNKYAVHLATPRIIPTGCRRELQSNRSSRNGIDEIDSTSSFDAESSCLNISERATTNNTFTDESDTDLDASSSNAGHNASPKPLASRKGFGLQPGGVCDLSLHDKVSCTQQGSKTHRKAIPVLNLQDLNTIEEETFSPQQHFEIYYNNLEGRTDTVMKPTDQRSTIEQTLTRRIIPKLKLGKIVQDKTDCNEPLVAPRVHDDKSTHRDKTQSIIPVPNSIRLSTNRIDCRGNLTARPGATHNSGSASGGSLTQRGKNTQRLAMDYAHMTLVKSVRTRKARLDVLDDAPTELCMESTAAPDTGNDLDCTTSSKPPLCESYGIQQPAVQRFNSDTTAEDNTFSGFVPNTFDDIADVPRHSHLSVRDIQLIGSKVAYLNHAGRDAILDDAAVINSGTFCIVVQGVYSGELVAVKMPEKHHLSTDPGATTSSNSRMENPLSM